MGVLRLAEKFKIRLGNVTMWATLCDGSFDLSFGSAMSQAEAPTLAALIESVDQALQLPQLEMLDDLQALALTVLYEDARAGRAWTVDGGRMRLNRSFQTYR